MNNIFFQAVFIQTYLIITDLGVRVVFRTEDFEPLAVRLFLAVEEVAEHAVVLNLGLELGGERGLGLNLKNGTK